MEIRSKMKLTILMAISLACFLLIAWQGFASQKTLDKTQKAKLSVDTFIDALKEGKVSKAEVYYYDWSAKPVHAIAESDLPKYCIYRITVRVNAPSENVLLQRVNMSLKKNKLLETQPKSVDFRLGCVFFSKDKELLRLFISKEEPSVAISGELFSADPDLVAAIMQFLPLDAYEEMSWGLLSDWAN